MNFLKKNGGFTLVELIVVIAILAILAAIAVPAYSGYISKANEAADQQLLASVNTAFAAACLDNNIDMLDVQSAVITLDADRKVAGISDVSTDTKTIASATMSQSFATYFAGNEDSAFKVYSGALYYSEGMGGFTEMPEAYKNMLGSFNTTDIDNVKNSTFATMGVPSMLGQVNTVSNTAASLIGTGNNAMYDVVTSPEYLTSLAGTLGMEPADLEAKLGSMSTDEMNNYLANSAVLSVAQTANNMTTSEITTLLTGGNLQNTITTTLNSDPETGLAQVALAYGMYTAYAQQSGNQELIAKANNVSDINDIKSILADMETTEFQTYVNGTQGQTDLTGYQSALNIIKDSASDPTTADSVLTNGFDDPALTALISAALGG